MGNLGRQENTVRQDDERPCRHRHPVRTVVVLGETKRRRTSNLEREKEQNKTNKTTSSTKFLEDLFGSTFIQLWNLQMITEVRLERRLIIEKTDILRFTFL